MSQISRSLGDEKGKPAAVAETFGRAARIAHAAALSTANPHAPFSDSRQLAVAQRRLQDMATNSTQVTQLQGFGAIANGRAQTIQMLPDWANLILGIGGAAVGGAALLGAAPVALGIGGALALATGIKGGYDNVQERARLEKARRQKKLNADFMRLYSAEQQLLGKLRSMRPDQRKGRAEVEKELDALNVRRRSLIKRTIDGGLRLWLPPSVKGGDRDTAFGLWNSISSNAGNIHVDQGDEQFRTSALADISKLLESGHGRTMLGNLNAQQHGGAARRIDILPTGGQTDNAPKGSPNDGHVGEGSTVSMNYGEPSANSMGANGAPVYDPTYIKLGHELGHASHNLAGTASYDNKTAEAHDDPLEEELWTSQEEHNNITGHENPLRRDLGLAPRVYHKGYEDVLRIRKIFPVTSELQKRRAKLKISPSIRKDHAAVLDEAEDWMHPNRKWDAYRYADLNKAIVHADAAMRALEKLAGA